MTEDDGEIDLKYDERYSRARRNSLAVSALLVLMSLSRFEGPAPLPIIGVSTYLPQKLAIGLLVVPTLFFFIGYWRVYKRTLDRNLEYIADAENGAPSAAIDRFLKELDAYRLRLRKLVELNNSFSKAVDKFERNYPEKQDDLGTRSNPMMNHPRYNAEIFKGTPEENAKTAMQLAIRTNGSLMQAESQIKFIRTTMKDATEEFSNNLPQVEIELKSISIDVKQIFRKMMKVSENIRKSDLKWFYLFDHIPTIAAFGISLISAAYAFANLAYGVRFSFLRVFDIFY